MRSELKKKYFHDPGSKGLPEHYPSPPPDKDLLFYIQRNQNYDTIVYKLNRTVDGYINRDLPIHAYWIKYSEGGIIRNLNHLQNKLAYGYESKQINQDLFSFHFVAYPELIFYIVSKDTNRFHVVTEINGQKAVLSNIYVYAVEFGVFPDVKFIELYGEELNSGIFIYQKISIN